MAFRQTNHGLSLSGKEGTEKELLGWEIKGGIKGTETMAGRVDLPCARMARCACTTSLRSVASVLFPSWASASPYDYITAMVFSGSTHVGVCKPACPSLLAL